MKIPENIRRIMQKLLDADYEAFIIGGAIRSHLMNEKPHDYDLFTNATGEDILRLFPQGKVLGGKERQEKILTVIVDGTEVSQYRANGDRTQTGTDFEKHISTCDLTINAMACDIDGNIIDLIEGRLDLKHKQIVFVGNPIDRINEDPLRLLRMVRFASKYNFEIIYNYDEYIGETIELLDTLPGERIREELEKILVYPSAIENLKQFDILYHLFPEFKLVENMTGGDKHNETVFEHLNESYKTACSITDDFKLRFTALFHDIGKGVTKEEIKEKSTIEMPIPNSEILMPFSGEILKTTFYGHEEEGEKIFLKYAEKYKFSKDETKFIAFLIRNHMYGYHSLDDINNRTLVKFFNKMEAAGIGILDFVTMLYCDNQGNLAKPRIKFKDFIEDNFFYQKYHSLKKTQPFSVKDLEVNGNDLIKLDYEGMDIGLKLNNMFHLVLDGELVNRRDRLMEYLLK